MNQEKNSSYGDWEAIIGLEIHAELNTKSKMFSTAPNVFGQDPNTNIDEVCTAMPGSLPVVNQEAIRKAVQFGCAIGGTVHEFSQFDRKSYFYPDSPRNFQITQYEHPIVTGGEVICVVDGTEQTFQITRAHLEDDSGMLKHFTSFAGVDFNRAGVPLIEIVSEPCMRTPREASSYAMAIRAILEYIDASDCNMEEGSLRFDVNVSVRKIGETGFRNKTEIKNMNSFQNLEIAINYEIQRQIEEYEKNPDKNQKEVITQSTLRFDPEKGKTFVMRKKEHAEDYRYFPEPDLLPLIITKEYIEDIRSKLPELPYQKERRYVSELKLSPYQAFTLTSEKKLADYFEECLKSCKNASSLTNWIMVEFTGRLKEKGISIANSEIAPSHIALLVNMIDDGIITGKIAKSVADDMVLNPKKSPVDIVEENPAYKPVNDRAIIEAHVDEVISNNMQSVQDFIGGRDRAFAFLVGQVMKATKGQATPQLVNDLLNEKIEKIKSS